MLPGAWNPASSAQAGDTGGAADGRMLAGYSFAIGSSPGFVDLEVGYRVRTAGPPDEWHCDATIGLKPAPGVILMLQDFAVVSMPSTDPSFPAWRQNVVEASLVLPLREQLAGADRLVHDHAGGEDEHRARRGAGAVAEVLVYLSSPPIRFARRSAISDRAYSLTPTSRTARARSACGGSRSCRRRSRRAWRRAAAGPADNRWCSRRRRGSGSRRGRPAVARSAA